MKKVMVMDEQTILALVVAVLIILVFSGFGLIHMMMIFVAGGIIGYVVRGIREQKQIPS